MVDFDAEGLDLADEGASLSELARDVRGFPRRMRKRVADAVDREVANHPYTNRTGDAQRSTQATEYGTDDDGGVGAEMGVEYASFLNNGGWSLFEGVIEKAAERVDDDFESLDLNGF